MLKNSTVTAILAVQDIEASKKFYEGKLGLKVKGQHPTGEYILSGNGGAEIALRPMSDAKPTGLTEITFEVTDIEKKVEELEKAGVQFEDYDVPEYKTDSHHICTKDNEKAAWFKDPTGNILCVHEYQK